MKWEEWRSYRVAWWDRAGLYVVSLIGALAMITLITFVLIGISYVLDRALGYVQHLYTIACQQ